MNTEMILSDIDELGTVTLESSIEVLDTMIEFYDKSMNILNNDRTGNGSSIIQESAIFLERDESIVKTIALAIPRLIAALIRAIKNAILPPSKSRGGGIINIRNDSKGPFDVACAAIESDPDLIYKVGGGIAAGAGAVKIWTANKAKAVKAKVDEKKRKLAEKAISKAKYVEYKNKADYSQANIVRIIIDSPTKLRVYTDIQKISDLGKFIDAYVNTVIDTVSRLSSNVDKGEKRKDFEEQLNVAYNIAQYPNIIQDFCGGMGYYHIYDSPEDFFNEIDAVLNKGIKSYEESIKALDETIKTAFDYYSDKKLVKLNRKESRDKKNTADADAWALKFATAVVNNLTYFTSKFKGYKDDCAKIINGLTEEEKKKRGSGEKNTGSRDKNSDVFDKDNTTNLKNLFVSNESDYNIYVKVLNLVCKTIQNHSYKLNNVADSKALFVPIGAVPAGLSEQKILVKAEKDGVHITKKVTVGALTDADGGSPEFVDKLRIFTTMTTRSGIDTKAEYASRTDYDTDSLNNAVYDQVFVHYKGLFNNIIKAIEGGGSQ